MSTKWWPIPGCEHFHPRNKYCTHFLSPAGKCTPWACPVNHTHRLPYKAEMVAARRDPLVLKDVTRRVIVCTNSTVDGHRWAKAEWARLDFDKAWVDPGFEGYPLSYLKVPLKDGDTIHRVRPALWPGDLVLFGEALELEPEKQGNAGVLALYSHDKAKVEVDPEAAEAKGWRLYGGKWLMWPWQRSTQASVFCPAELVRDEAVVISSGPVRLSDTTHEEALREGVSRKLATEWGIATSPSEEEFNLYQARGVFRDIWNEINGKRCPWDSNAFVWRTEVTKWGELREAFPA